MKPNEAVLICCNADCQWIGTTSETVHPKHDPTHLLCPVCNEVTEVILEPRKDWGFWMLTEEGHTVHINGDRNMDADTARALARMCDLAAKQLTQE